MRYFWFIFKKIFVDMPIEVFKGIGTSFRKPFVNLGITTLCTLIILTLSIYSKISTIQFDPILYIVLLVLLLSSLFGSFYVSGIFKEEYREKQEKKIEKIENITEIKPKENNHNETTIK